MIDVMIPTAVSTRQNPRKNMLKKVNRFAVTDGNTLTFMIDDVAVMRFTKS